jgi:hypothetical protein
MAAAAWLKQHAAGEAQLRRALLRYFGDQAHRVVKALGKTPTVAAAAEAFREAAEHELMMETIADPIIGMMATGALTVLKARPKQTKKFEFSSALPERVQAAIELAWGELETQDYWRVIQATTAEHLTKIIGAAIDDGLNGREMSRRIEQALGGLARVRADAIARTETTAAYNAGHEASYAALAEDGLRLPARSGWRWSTATPGRRTSI